MENGEEMMESVKTDVSAGSYTGITLLVKVLSVLKGIISRENMIKNTVEFL